MALTLMLGPSAAAAQWSLEPAAGVAVGGPLFRDAAVEGFSEIEVAPAPAPILALHARTPVNEVWSFDVGVAWSRGTLQADGRELSGLQIIGATAQLRRRVGPLLGGIGVGALSYSAPDAMVYADGASVFPAAALSAAVALGTGDLPIQLTANLGMHRHQTPVLERAGADAALVWRAALMIGIELGGGR